MNSGSIENRFTKKFELGCDCVKFSKDGRYLAIGLYEKIPNEEEIKGGIMILDLKDSAYKEYLQMHKGVLHLEWLKGNDNKILTSNVNGTMTLYSFENQVFKYHNLKLDIEEEEKGSFLYFTQRFVGKKHEIVVTNDLGTMFYIRGEENLEIKSISKITPFLYHVWSCSFTSDPNQFLIVEKVII